MGRFISEGGSNFWGVHKDQHEGEQINRGSDRNTELWIFRFICEDEVLDPDTRIDTGLYCCRQPPA